LPYVRTGASYRGAHDRRSDGPLRGVGRQGVALAGKAPNRIAWLLQCGGTRSRIAAHRAHRIERLLDAVAAARAGAAYAALRRLASLAPAGAQLHTGGRIGRVLESHDARVAISPRR